MISKIVNSGTLLEKGFFYSIFECNLMGRLPEFVFVYIEALSIDCQLHLLVFYGSS